MAAYIPTEDLTWHRPCSSERRLATVPHGRGKAVLCSDFGRRMTTSAENLDTVAFRDEAVEAQSGEKAVLVCDFAAAQRRKLALVTERDETGHGGVTVEMDGFKFDTSSAAGRGWSDEDEQYYGAVLRSHENLPALSISNYGRSLGCSNPASGFARCNVGIESNGDRSYYGAADLEAYHRMDGIQQGYSTRITASLRQASQLEASLTVPSEDPQQSLRHDSPGKPRSSSIALERLAMIRSQLESRLPTPVIPDVQCKRSQCQDRLARLIATSAIDTGTNLCVHEGCGRVSRSREEWEGHVAMEHHVEGRDRLSTWEDWGEGGMCGA
ncbi:unnamed protein product [Zymoseptoria tritici ST99CH_1A5]|uniref:Uncharacterized protein n=1 Tax=Zymoseptoria tritici ST99CH_1A5 TaxID=1276529 RepID=A0A1Y6L7F6_ZYMTR|nr:unnamed protein product [Zymoseptoria tritici ST99CH_3D1]SMY20427.1 unnamed protein product [Zymoseptoria tritici ST99CH_1A5]